MMKTIGLIGGMSWESTVTYYQLINQAVKEALGGLHSAKLLLYSMDFAQIEACQSAGAWAQSGELLTDAGLRLERAGADFLVICTNTMHKLVPQMEERLSVPILHIAQATAHALHDAEIGTVGLLGTKYTMQQDFYKERLIQAGIQVLLPGPDDMELVNRVIYEELCLGIISDRSKAEFLRIIGALAARGAKGVILGCTEIGLLIDQSDTPLPVFDTARVHALAAAELALSEA